MSGNTNNTVFIQRLFSSRDNFTEGNVQEATSNALAFVGQQDRIWWEPTTNSFYYSDGNTPGGIPIGGGGGSNISNGNSNVNIATSNGNVSITSNGTYTWTFDGTGNLVLPANSFNVNYANGTQVPLGGGDLPIANGTSSIDIPTANSFVTITSNTYWTWFFGPDGSLILPQNSATGNIGAIVGPYGANTILRAPTAGSAFVENNTSFNKLSVADSNITITTSPDSGSTYKNWIFDTAGNLNVPESIKGRPDNDFLLRAIDAGKSPAVQLQSFSVSSDQVTSLVSVTRNVIEIGSNLSGTTQYWRFDNTGNLTLPTNSFNVNYANGTQVPLNITPTYGQFWSNLLQTVASANTEYKFLFNNSGPNSNVVLGTGASNSRIIINQTGLYNIQFSAQVDKTGGGTSSAYIWFKKNGTAVTDSSGFITLDAAIQTVESWNILANVTTAGDYYEIAYASSSTNFSFPTIAGNNIVGYPASPSIIVTVTPL